MNQKSELYPYAELNVYLREFDTLPLLSETQKQISTFTGYLQNGTHNEETRKVTSDLLNKLRFIHEQVNHVNALITQNKDLVHQRMNELKFKHESKSGELSLAKIPLSVVLDTISNKPTQIVREFIASRIALNASWQFPALCIGDRHGSWLEEFRSADPLYITDFKQELVDIMDAKYTGSEKRRVKAKVSPEYNLSYYPKNQLGCVLVWEIFDYLKESTVYSMLKQIYELLTDGGTVIFSYNNIEDLRNASYPSKSPTTKSGIINYCKNLGYTVSASHDVPGSTYVLELQKGGIKNSIKLSVPLGEINRKEI